MLPKDFSNALGFSKKCILEANALTKYDRSAWWNEISDEPVSSKNSIVSIHNPTLRVLAKYLAMVVFSRADLRLCSSSELMCLYAMAKKIRYSPVMGMVENWQKMITCKISHRHNLTGHPHCTVYRCFGECTSHISARDR